MLSEQQRIENGRLNRVLISSVIGMTLILSPLKWQVRGIAAGIFMTPGLAVLLSGYNKYRNTKDDLLSGQDEIESVEKRIQDLDRESERLEREIEAKREAARLEVDSLRNVKFEELELRERELNDKIRRLDEDMAQIDSMRIDAEREASILKSKALAEATAEIDSKRLDAMREQRDFDKNMAEERAQWAADKRIQEAELDIKAREIESLRQRKESEADMLLAETIQNCEVEKAQLENLKAATNREIEELRRHFDKEKQLWELEKEKERAELEAELESLVDEATSQHIKTEVGRQVQAKLKPYIDDITNLKAKLKHTEDQLTLAKMRLEEVREPQKPKGMHPKAVFGRAVVEFYEARGINLDCILTEIGSQHYRIVVRPWEDDPVKARKSIERYFDTLIWEFELDDGFPVELGVHLEGFEIKMKPLHNLFFGMKPQVNDPALHEVMTPRRYSDNPFHQLDELPSPSEVGANQDQLAEQFKKETEAREMLVFTPPERPFPRTGEIADLELKTAKYYYFWQEKATRGKVPNVKTVNGLIDALYQVKPGGATTRPNQFGETLRDRVHRILEIIGAKQAN